MRFYVPEWDDRVDAKYDFLHDEHSVLETDDRDLAYIWDVFEKASTPIDGVLVSREQVGESKRKADRLKENGIYDAPNLQVPKWLPTISDCGAWGYKSLPFPPYGNEEMLEFYEQLDVTTGVTIDHLVLGGGHTSRLYLDERAFSSAFRQSDLPETLTSRVDIMVDSWPTSSGTTDREWPSYVRNEEPSIYGVDEVEPFHESDFEGTIEDIIDRLSDDPRAVYRDDDMQYRYDLTLRNAEEMRELHRTGNYSYRLMAAVQGWTPGSYVKATDAVLDMGYRYVGIGGVAGSQERDVKEIVSAAGNGILDFERDNETRIDVHVFGFAKTGAFETIGRSGVTSFDSASMLRSAWTGGSNYHLSRDERYDALRVRYPSPDDDLEMAVEKALRAQEVLHALRAFDANDSIATALWQWHGTASQAIDGLLDYLESHRWDDRYDHSILREVEGEFREHYRFGRELKASFSDRFRRRLLKLLRADDRDDPVQWRKYLTLVSTAATVFDDRFPSLIDEIEAAEEESGAIGTFEHLWPLVEAYATFVDDRGLLDAYETLLKETPWRRCPCTICSTHGIEVAIFRGNNRNRRRGFHNTRRFYDEFQERLPKMLVLTRPDAKLSNVSTVESYLRERRPAFWQAVNDLPVAEIGVMTADGVHEWWEPPPKTISFAPSSMTRAVADECVRYGDIFIDESERSVSERLKQHLTERDCNVQSFEQPTELSQAVHDRLGIQMQSSLSGY